MANKVSAAMAAFAAKGEDEQARRLLASALFATTRLGESPTLGGELFKYGSQARALSLSELKPVEARKSAGMSTARTPIAEFRGLWRS